MWINVILKEHDNKTEPFNRQQNILSTITIIKTEKKLKFITTVQTTTSL